MWRAHDGMGWWMIFGGLLWLLFWAAIIYLVASAVSGSRSGGAPKTPSDPLDIARRRYASGEISREEFQRIRADLETHRTGPPPPSEH